MCFQDKKPLTRAQLEKIELDRKKDRERKRIERAGWTRQKRKAESLKTSERRKSKKMQQKSDMGTQTTPPKETQTTPPKEDSRNTHARHQALYR